MSYGTATIVSQNFKGIHMCASAGRISTQPGTALELFNEEKETAKDVKLVGKVVSSGHRSVIEHHTFSIAFDNVSVLVEQFMIEFRLCSFTVKSRRYVDFSSAGYVVPNGMDPETENAYKQHMDSLFAAYDKLIELGIPKEDARFVLPYCFRSNFYVTLNARELIHVIASMLYGRGSGYEELRLLGESLKAQFDEVFPGIIEKQENEYRSDRVSKRIPAYEGECRKASAEVVSYPQNAQTLFESALDFEGRYGADEIRELMNDTRTRPLEMLYFNLMVKNVSLSCTTHFVRHRILSILVPDIVTSVYRRSYMIPPTVAADPEAVKIYEEAFTDNDDICRHYINEGKTDILPYFALSGYVIDLMIGIDGRELVHMLKLRTCNRAQWEIRGISVSLLKQLRSVMPELFGRTGPGCFMNGKCPEGRLSCGQPWKEDAEI